MKRFYFGIMVWCWLASLSPVFSAGPTNVTSPINASVTWTKDNSPYVIQNDVVVSTGAILTLEPGVEVQFVSHSNASTGDGPNLIIQGGLKAIGNTASPIVFDASTRGAQWGALYFYNADSVNSILQACLIGGGRVVCNNASPTITQSAIYGSKSGIEVGNYSQPQIIGNRITANGVGIILLSDTASPIISGNAIYNNNYGFYLKAFGNPRISGNKIQNNLKYNVVNYSSASLDAPNNDFGVTDAQAITRTIYDGNWSSSLGRFNFVPYVGMSESQGMTRASGVATEPSQKPNLQADDLWNYGRPFDAMKMTNVDSAKKKPSSSIQLIAVGATAVLAVGLIFL